MGDMNSKFSMIIEDAKLLCVNDIIFTF